VGATERMVRGGPWAIVTGTGERIAWRFVEEGAEVGVARRREADSAAKQQRLSVGFVRTDVTCEADVKPWPIMPFNSSVGRLAPRDELASRIKLAAASL
jgi:hypothetical protein